MILDDLVVFDFIMTSQEFKKKTIRMPEQNYPLHETPTSFRTAPSQTLTVNGNSRGPLYRLIFRPAPDHFQMCHDILLHMKITHNQDTFLTKNRAKAIPKDYFYVSSA